MQRSAFEVESSDSNFQARGREELSRSAEREKHTDPRMWEGGEWWIARGRGSRDGYGVGVESCGRIRCPFPGKSRRSIETCIMAAIIHFLSDRGDLLYGGCSVHASPSLSVSTHMYTRAPPFTRLSPTRSLLSRSLFFYFSRPSTLTIVVYSTTIDVDSVLSLVWETMGGGGRSDRARICSTNNNKWDGYDWKMLEDRNVNRTNEAI